MFLYCSKLLLTEAMGEESTEDSLRIPLPHDSLPIQFSHDLARIEPHVDPPFVVLQNGSTVFSNPPPRGALSLMTSADHVAQQTFLARKSAY